MCGIAGIVDLRRRPEPVPRERLSQMLGIMTHRGPDELGIYRDRRAGLAHARLSIIDLSTGQQPLANETGNLWIVFNGEIFNYVELRNELEGHGHRFATKSDTEVIVHAWEQWGEEAFGRFNGQWAIALWDARAETLVLCRDRVGVRPLYYAEHDGRLAFASEVKALFAGLPELPRAFDPIGIEQTFTFWSVVAPRTVFRDVHELRPGHLRIYKPGQAAREAPYFEPRYPRGDVDRFSGSLSDAAVALREALERATSLRMLRADVPVGSYLSGGLDSSVVAALAKRAQPKGFSTFSLRFADPEYDETSHQRTMVDRLGTNHSEIVVGARDVAEVFPKVIWHTERPILRNGPAPLYLLSQLVRERGIKVVLTGEGADEVLAGYDLFREGKVRRFWARRPQSTWRPRLLERLYPYLARSPMAQQATARQFFGRGLEHARSPGFAHHPRWNSAAALKRLFAPAQHDAVRGYDVVAELLADLPAAFGEWSSLAQDQYLEVRTLLSGYLLSSQGDRMLMASSVEGRFPFLDKDVMALTNSFPDAYKLAVLDEKHVLKAAARDLVPDSIRERAKQPYRAPDALAFVGAGRPTWVDELMSASAIDASGVFDSRAVTQLWSKALQRGDGSQFSNTDNMAIVAVLSTQILHRDFIAHQRAASPVSIKTDIDRIAEAA